MTGCADRGSGGRVWRCIIAASRRRRRRRSFLLLLYFRACVYCATILFFSSSLSLSALLQSQVFERVVVVG